jgi:tRNA(fMet)-specific endonuclease VapC
VADFLIDTNILRYWYDSVCPEHAKVVARVKVACQPDQQTEYVSRLFVSVVTLGEIEYGHCVTLKPDPSKQAAYAQFVQTQCPDVLEINKHVVVQYGEMRAWLFNNCGPKVKKSKTRRAEELINPTTGKELGIDENDIWIAAQAKTHNLVLVTHDFRGNFGKVLSQFASSLMVEDWAS